jgi:hypothetical protein
MMVMLLCLMKTMYLPSGDHTGPVLGPKYVFWLYRRLRCDPFELITHSSPVVPPVCPRLRKNAICLPSGDQTGSPAPCEIRVSRSRDDPSGCIV